MGPVTLRNAAARAAGLPLMLIACLAMTACSPGGSGSGEPSLFPLDKGWRWTYASTSDSPDPLLRQPLVVENLGARTMPDGSTAFERRNSLGNSYYFVTGAAGIARVASRSAVAAQPRPDDDDQGRRVRYVLKQPLQVGTRWQAPTWPFLTRRGFDWPQELRLGKPVVMDFRIESVDEPVTVPAGSFAHCVHVTGLYTLKATIDPVIGYAEIPFTQHEWYCPGTGMVKLTRDEPLNGKYFSGGSLRLELTKLER